jgi:hypothetical protein
MGLMTVKERGETVATWRAVMVSLMETLAAWVPTTPEMEAKLVFGTHIWDAAQHADSLGKRTYELRLPLQFSQPPVSAYGEFLRDVANLTDTRQRVAAVYDVILPALTARFRTYLSRTDSLLDAPTVRILDRIMADEARMIGEGRDLCKEVSELQLGDSAWTQALAAREASIDPIVEPRLREPVAIGAS